MLKRMNNYPAAKASVECSSDERNPSSTSSSFSSDDNTNKYTKHVINFKESKTHVFYVIKSEDESCENTSPLFRIKISKRKPKSRKLSTEKLFSHCNNDREMIDNSQLNARKSRSNLASIRKRTDHPSFVVLPEVFSTKRGNETIKKNIDRNQSTSDNSNETYVIRPREENAFLENKSNIPVYISALLTNNDQKTVNSTYLRGFVSKPIAKRDSEDYCECNHDALGKYNDKINHNSDSTDLHNIKTEPKVSARNKSPINAKNQNSAKLFNIKYVESTEADKSQRLRAGQDREIRYKSCHLCPHMKRIFPPASPSTRSPGPSIYSEATSNLNPSDINGYVNINYKLVRQCLIYGSPYDKSEVLDAIRLRMKSPDSNMAMNTIRDIVKFDLFGVQCECRSKPLLEELFWPINVATPFALQTSIARFVNALVSHKIGRDYFDNRSIIHLLTWGDIGRDNIDTEMGDNLISIMMKLSFNRYQCSDMLHNGLLHWLLSHMAEVEYSCSKYHLECMTKLLRNLLRSSETNDLSPKEIKKLIVLLGRYLDTKSDLAKIYICQSLLSLCQKREAVTTAKDLNFRKIIDEHMRKAVNKKQKEHLLAIYQLLNSSRTSKSSNNGKFDYLSEQDTYLDNDIESVDEDIDYYPSEKLLRDKYSGKKKDKFEKKEFLERSPIISIEPMKESKLVSRVFVEPLNSFLPTIEKNRIFPLGKSQFVDKTCSHLEETPTKKRQPYIPPNSRISGFPRQLHKKDTKEIPSAFAGDDSRSVIVQRKQLVDDQNSEQTRPFISMISTISHDISAPKWDHFQHNINNALPKSEDANKVQRKLLKCSNTMVDVDTENMEAKETLNVTRSATKDLDNELIDDSKQDEIIQKIIYYNEPSASPISAVDAQTTINQPVTKPNLEDTHHATAQKSEEHLLSDRENVRLVTTSEEHSYSEDKDKDLQEKQPDKLFSKSDVHATSPEDKTNKESLSPVKKSTEDCIGRVNKDDELQQKQSDNFNAKSAKHGMGVKDDQSQEKSTPTINDGAPIGRVDEAAQPITKLNNLFDDRRSPASGNSNHTLVEFSGKQTLKPKETAVRGVTSDLGTYSSKDKVNALTRHSSASSIRRSADNQKEAKRKQNTRGDTKGQHNTNRNEFVSEKRNLQDLSSSEAQMLNEDDRKPSELAPNTEARGDVKGKQNNDRNEIVSERGNLQDLSSPESLMLKEDDRKRDELATSMINELTTTQNTEQQSLNVQHKTTPSSVVEPNKRNEKTDHLLLNARSDEALRPKRNQELQGSHSQIIETKQQLHARSDVLFDRSKNIPELSTKPFTHSKTEVMSGVPVDSRLSNKDVHKIGEYAVKGHFGTHISKDHINAITRHSSDSSISRSADKEEQANGKQKTDRLENIPNEFVSESGNIQDLSFDETQMKNDADTEGDEVARNATLEREQQYLKLRPSSVLEPNEDLNTKKDHLLLNARSNEALRPNRNPRSHEKDDQNFEAKRQLHARSDVLIARSKSVHESISPLTQPKAETVTGGQGLDESVSEVMKLGEETVVRCVKSDRGTYRSKEKSAMTRHLSDSSIPRSANMRDRTKGKQKTSRPENISNEFVSGTGDLEDLPLREAQMLNDADAPKKGSELIQNVTSINNEVNFSLKTNQQSLEPSDGLQIEIPISPPDGGKEKNDEVIATKGNVELESSRNEERQNNAISKVKNQQLADSSEVKDVHKGKFTADDEKIDNSLMELIDTGRQVKDYNQVLNARSIEIPEQNLIRSNDGSGSITVRDKDNHQQVNHQQSSMSSKEKSTDGTFGSTHSDINETNSDQHTAVCLAQKLQLNVVNVLSDQNLSPKFTEGLQYEPISSQTEPISSQTEPISSQTEPISSQTEPNSPMTTDEKGLAEFSGIIMDDTSVGRVSDNQLLISHQVPQENLSAIVSVKQEAFSGHLLHARSLEMVKHETNSRPTTWQHNSSASVGKPVNWLLTTDVVSEYSSSSTLKKSNCVDCEGSGYVLRARASQPCENCRASLSKYPNFVQELNNEISALENTQQRIVTHTSGENIKVTWTNKSKEILNVKGIEEKRKEDEVKVLKTDGKMVKYESNLSVKKTLKEKDVTQLSTISIRKVLPAVQEAGKDIDLSKNETKIEEVNDNLTHSIKKSQSQSAGDLNTDASISPIKSKKKCKSDDQLSRSCKRQSVTATKSEEKQQSVYSAAKSKVPVRISKEVIGGVKSDISFVGPMQKVKDEAVTQSRSCIPLIKKNSVCNARTDAKTLNEETHKRELLKKVTSEQHIRKPMDKSIKSCETTVELANDGTATLKDAKQSRALEKNNLLLFARSQEIVKDSQRPMIMMKQSLEATQSTSPKTSEKWFGEKVADSKSDIHQLEKPKEETFENDPSDHFLYFRSKRLQNQKLHSKSTGNLPDLGDDTVEKMLSHQRLSLSSSDKLLDEKIAETVSDQQESIAAAGESQHHNVDEKKIELLIGNENTDHLMYARSLEIVTDKKTIAEKQKNQGRQQAMLATKSENVKIDLKNESTPLSITDLLTETTIENSSEKFIEEESKTTHVQLTNPQDDLPISNELSKDNAIVSLRDEENVSVNLEQQLNSTEVKESHLHTSLKSVKVKNPDQPLSDSKNSSKDVDVLKRSKNVSYNFSTKACRPKSSSFISVAKSRAKKSSTNTIKCDPSNQSLPAKCLGALSFDLKISKSGRNKNLLIGKQVSQPPKFVENIMAETITTSGGNECLQATFVRRPTSVIRQEVKANICIPESEEQIIAIENEKLSSGQDKNFNNIIDEIIVSPTAQPIVSSDTSHDASNRNDILLARSVELIATKQETDILRNDNEKVKVVPTINDSIPTQKMEQLPKSIEQTVDTDIADASNERATFRDDEPNMSNESENRSTKESPIKIHRENSAFKSGEDSRGDKSNRRLSAEKVMAETINNPDTIDCFFGTLESRTTDFPVESSKTSHERLKDETRETDKEKKSSETGIDRFDENLADSANSFKEETIIEDKDSQHLQDPSTTTPDKDNHKQLSRSSIEKLTDGMFGIVPVKTQAFSGQLLHARSLERVKHGINSRPTSGQDYSSTSVGKSIDGITKNPKSIVDGKTNFLHARSLERVISGKEHDTVRLGDETTSRKLTEEAVSGQFLFPRSVENVPRTLKRKPDEDPKTENVVASQGSEKCLPDKSTGKGGVQSFASDEVMIEERIFRWDEKACGTTIKDQSSDKNVSCSNVKRGSKEKRKLRANNSNCWRKLLNNDELINRVSKKVTKKLLTEFRNCGPNCKSPCCGSSPYYNSTKDNNQNLE